MLDSQQTCEFDHDFQLTRVCMMGGFVDLSDKHSMCQASLSINIGALIITIGFWGPLYYNYTRKLHDNSTGHVRP